MKSKFLIIPNKMFEKKGPNYDFLFPLKGYCVGFLHEYDIDEIKNDSYIYVNRILNTKDINALKEVLKKRKFKGIVFEDLGIIDLLPSGVEKILYPTHAACSLHTINSYLQYVDTVVLSLDITKEEMRQIIYYAHKPISLYTYGPIFYMYSRRTLLKNYQKQFHKHRKSIESLEEVMSKKQFVMIENDYGTVCLDRKRYDGRILLEEEPVKYHLLNLDFEKIDDLDSWLKDFLEHKQLLDVTDAFLHMKTIYRLPPRKE